MRWQRLRPGQSSRRSSPAPYSAQRDTVSRRPFTGRDGSLYRHHMPSRAAARRGRPWWALVTLVAACATLILNAGCEGSAAVRNAQSSAVSESLDSVEIDDSPVSLPKTELVTCVPVSPNDYLFSWTGSNQVVPRRPLEETETSSRVTVRFDVDPPDVKSLDLLLFFRGTDLEMREPSDRSAGSLTITQSGPRRYLLVGMAEIQSSQQQAPHHLRIELHC
jgi:hypothetical protein